MCKHVVGIAIIIGSFQVPDTVKTDHGQKRRPRRPRKVKGALLVDLDLEGRLVVTN